MELSALSENQIRAAVEENPRVAELVTIAWEEAARTSAEETRWLLAKLAAQCLSGSITDDEIDPVPFLMKTVANLEPQHIQLLILIAMPRTSESPNEFYWQEDHLAERWPSSSELLRPMLTQLEREAVIESGNWQFKTTEYGRKLLGYLFRGPYDPGGMFQAALSAFISRPNEPVSSNFHHLVMLNHGVATASAVTLFMVEHSTEGWKQIWGPQIIRPDERRVPDRPNVVGSSWYGIRLGLKWSDPNGTWKNTFTLSHYSQRSDTWRSAALWRNLPTSEDI